MKNKTIVITGASRGIGRAISLKYAQMGYNVAINCARNAEALDELAAEIKTCGVQCVTHVGDIGDFKQAQIFFNKITEAFDKIDILINNAGISYIGLLQDMYPEEWNNIVNTNLTSVFNCCKLAIPVFLKNMAGKIINISSVWGVTGASTEVAYSATKGGINAFTMALAKELAPSNIQVNAVACGIIDTDMNKFLDAEEMHMIIDEVPAGRLGRPGEVAEFIYKLTDGNDYLTGQVIKFDGGWI